MTMKPKVTTIVDQHIGLAIKARRTAIGLSQDGLAAKLGVTFQQVQKYEKGVNRVAVARLIDIARALQTPLASLLPGDIDPTDAPISPQVAALSGRPALQMVELFHGLPPEKRRPAFAAIVKLLELMQPDA